jgi:hypothetical protein
MTLNWQILGSGRKPDAPLVHGTDAGLVALGANRIDRPNHLVLKTIDEGAGITFGVGQMAWPTNQDHVRDMMIFPEGASDRASAAATAPSARTKQSVWQLSGTESLERRVNSGKTGSNRHA